MPGQAHIDPGDVKVDSSTSPGFQIRPFKKEMDHPELLVRETRRLCGPGKKAEQRAAGMK